ncbi:addiction module antidote protein [Alloscardovia sp. HMSC034E08]|uniref:addiction module antidote protein n=1 Tax=Alloscardovia sp. HMSC034E08 TaxID=1739413 RepID=UPI000A00B004|nr:addiction module antidote protein [Alloscardovia sp. HMSC034E08]
MTFDPVDYLDDEEAVTAYLDTAIQRDDVEVFLDALDDVARAYGMGKIANEVDVHRVSLYKSLSKQGNPSFATVKKVLSALGFIVPTSSNLRCSQASVKPLNLMAGSCGLFSPIFMFPFSICTA